MKEEGRIIKIDGQRVVVQLEAKGACSSCGMSHFCHSSGSDSREMSLEYHGTGISQGDLVEIETPARSVLSAAFLVFIFPLILSIIAYSIVYYATKSTGYGLIGFFGCFVLSELLVALFDRSFGRGKFFEPRILGLLDSRPDRQNMTTKETD
jgi:positive regulator of sigma E activity